ncbi:MarR family transcriptional regulator [Haladaptatus sp. DYF46]|uniref:helix-turn-helix transcriptional regulator n=1 Tax=Haladaptatus sp. DYF46 TaxID=2886041 RepID=UPI001E4CE61B|nr:MarR family transcriptional regulator [Haladaptatus sp. DYF46]
MITRASSRKTANSLSARENRALALITEQKGIYQSDLWKELEVSSRTGSRLATSLEKKGMIQREETTYNGQRTYLLHPRKKDLDFSLLMAGDMLSPLVSAEEESDPIDSNAFTQWVLQLSQEAY